MSNLVDLGIAGGCSQAALRRDLRGYGCEIEFEVEDGNDASFEARRLVRAMGGSWNITHDGSLRNGMELFSPDFPFPTRREMKLYLERYFQALEGSCIKPSWRAATQFHIDIGDFSIDQLKALVILYAALEPYLFQLAARGRDESNFCVPWYIASQPYYDLLSTSDVSNILPECSKYSALNLSPLLRQGTVEFRHFETPARPTDRLHRYFDACVNLIDEAIVIGRSHFFSKHLTAGLESEEGLAHYLQSRVLGQTLAGAARVSWFGKTREVLRRSDDLVTQLAEAVLSATPSPNMLGSEEPGEDAPEAVLRRHFSAAEQATLNRHAFREARRLFAESNPELSEFSSLYSSTDTNEEVG